MRISLAIRSFLGYLLVMILLGSVAAYTIASMDRMRHQVSLIRRDLLPVGATLEQLSRETAAFSSALRRGRKVDATWLQQTLPAFKPFARMERVLRRVERVERGSRIDGPAEAELTEFVARTRELVEGTSLSRDLEESFERTDPEFVKWLKGLDDRTNPSVFQAMVDAYVNASKEPGERSLRTWRTRVRAMLKLILGHLRTLHGDYGRTVTEAWTSAEKQEEQAVVAAAAMGGIGILISLALSLLGVRWLMPIRRLREMAFRIAKGKYDTRVKVRSNDELGDLAADLERMAGKLQEREEMIRSQGQELLRSERLSAIGKMSTQIAHEIRNPLNAIGLRLELLDESVGELEGDVPAERLQEIREIGGHLTREVERLTEVTDYYLRFAKFPSPQKEPMDLTSMLEDLLNFFRQEAESMQATVQWDVPETLPLQGDSNLLRLAVLNLLKNSLESLAGRPDGTISLRAWTEGDQVRLRITDNGPGIEEETRRRIFEPFFSTKEGGTGLGLTLVQQITREHGGTIDCSSEPKKGTTFHLSLPA